MAEHEEAARKISRELCCGVKEDHESDIKHIAKFLASYTAEKDRVIFELRDAHEPTRVILEREQYALGRAEQAKSKLMDVLHGWAVATDDAYQLSSIHDKVEASLTDLQLRFKNMEAAYRLGRGGNRELENEVNRLRIELAAMTKSRDEWAALASKRTGDA